MNVKSFLTTIFFFCSFLQSVNASVLPANLHSLKVLSTADAGELFEFSTDRPHPLIKHLKQRKEKNKKIVAAICAFPFPFGIVGLHRIYLGTSPYVPVVYIATLGGVFGVLPLIDFFIILLDKNTDKFLDNKKVFMWIN